MGTTELRDRLGAALGAGYTVVRELGGGGMSRIFLARDEALGRQVAVKVLAPELAEGLSAGRFAREIRLAAALQEPHIVPVLTAGTTADGLPYYTMPFVRGESLRARCARGPLPLSEAVAVLRDVACALAYAHRQGVVHRDIKPENVLLNEGTAVVTDFGIAKALSVSKAHAPDGAAGGTLTQVGASPGTPAYMAPEQAAADTVDHRADLYAWGIIAYELLSGRHPFACHSTAQQLLAAHIAETPTPLGSTAPSVPSELAALVMRCLAKEPSARPAGADELVRTLDAVTSGASHERGWAVHRRSAMRWTAGVVVVAIVAIAARAWRPPTARQTPAPAVAVLPFENLNGDSASAYVSDGMTEELIDVLGRTGVFRVASRATTFSYKGRHVDPREFAASTRVDAVLSGSVRRAGDRLRVVAELVRGSDGETLWRETYDRTPSDMLAIQEEIARSIASSLRVRLAPRDISGARRRVDPVAYDEYLQARQLLTPPHGSILTGARPKVERAIALLEHAVATDTAFGQAWAQLGRAYIAMAEYVPPRSVMPRAKVAVRRSLELDPTNAEVALSLASILLNYDWDWTGAEREYRRAVALDPRSVQARRQYALFLGSARRGEEAIRETLRANDLELQQSTDSGGLRAWHESYLGDVYAAAGRFDEARRHFAAALRLAPENPRVNWAAGRWLAVLGDPAGAARAMEFARRSLGDQLPLLTHVGMVYGMAGRTDSTRRILSELEARSRREYFPKDQIAGLYLALGHRNAALRWLERAIEERHYWMPLTNNGPWFRQLYGDPEFRRLMLRINVPEAAL